MVAGSVKRARRAQVARGQRAICWLFRREAEKWEDCKASGWCAEAKGLRRMSKIETQRTILRWLREEDLEAVTTLLGNPRVMRFSLAGVHTPEQCREFLDTCLASYQEKGYGIFAVVEKETDEVIGYCGFYDQIVEGRAEVEVAYRLLPRVWSKGLATEVVRRVQEFGFQELGFRRLISNIDSENHASARVAEKCGMNYERDFLYKGTLPVRVYAKSV
jgi:[ribosomal protein S5]-alanine N-acetyltransferase